MGTAILDVNDNRVFDGVGGGDANFTLAGFDNGASQVFVSGDFAGNGSDQVARYTASSLSTYIDQNGSYSWNGTGGGDRSFFFAPGQGFATPLVGDWANAGNDQWGLYSADNFLLDKNDNGTFDGNGGGDAFFALAASQGAGTPIAGDWNGTGKDCAGKVIAPSNNFILDLNCNDAWDGVGGGDANFFFASGQTNAIPLVGDWNGDGDDEIGLYNPANDQFFLDLNENRVWDGNAGGDANVVLSASSGAGTPTVCDWDGDGADDPGKLVGSSANFILDLNGNKQWDGNGGGDFNGFFGPGSGSGAPLPGVYTP